MKKQQGSALLILILGLAIVAILAGFYFTRGNDGEKSQYEMGEEGIEQAKEIKQKSIQQSQEIQQQLEIQNELNAQ